MSAYTLIGVSLLLGTPFFVVFGWLSDKIGRLKIIMAGCLIAAVTYFPLFGALTHYVNPALEEFAAKTPITVAATELPVPPVRRTVEQVLGLRPRQGLPDEAGSVVQDGPRRQPASPWSPPSARPSLEGWDQKKIESTLKDAGYKSGADKSQVNWVMAELILVHHGASM